MFDMKTLKLSAGLQFSDFPHMSHRLTAVKILTDKVKQELISCIYLLKQMFNQLRPQEKGSALNFVFELYKYFICIALKYLHRCQNNTRVETTTTTAAEQLDNKV